MAFSHDNTTASSHPSSSTVIESIPLQSTSRPYFKEDDSESDLDPESDAALLRHHRRRPSTPTPPDHPAVASTFWLRRIALFIMSRTPLLSPTSSGKVKTSYGAAETPEASQGSDSTTLIEDEIDDVRRRDRRRQDQAGMPAGITDGTGTGSQKSTAAHRTTHRRRRSSVNTYDISVGPQSRATFPSGHVPLPKVDGHMPNGSDDSSTLSDESDNEARKRARDDPVDNSPYPEVRSSVPATDNVTLSISTPRMWILSLSFAFLGSAANLFFSLRYPSVTIHPIIALILVHPVGKLWDLVLKRDDDPQHEFLNGVRITALSPDKNRFRLWLAQGYWNEKEHTCVYVSSNVAFGFAFATDVIVEQHKFYHQDVPILYQILLTLSTQIIGYAFAGLTRRFLVRPAAMIWPGNLAPTAMFGTMHKQENRPANGWKISRYGFFLVVWVCAFMWYFMPGLLMPALSYFNVLTWFAPDNVVVANLFGVASGLGLFPLTFDWAQIAYTGSPLLTPWWAAANVVGGLVVVMWIAAPILYYMNVLFSAYMPILSSAVFDNQGKPYDVAKILTKDFVFDRAAYEAYSHVYLPITYVLSYALQFAGISALVTHTACWHGRDIWTQSKKALEERSEKLGDLGYRPLNGQTEDAPIDEPDETPPPQVGQAGLENMMAGEDVHSRLMKSYSDAPMTWYLLIFVIMLAISIFVVDYYPVHLPWYGLLLALGITTILYIPAGIVMAIANVHSSLYLICQLICGVVFPGRPVANMVFTTYCYITSAQGIKFSSDLKLGHYMKIPPRLLFNVQVIATIVGCLTQVAVLNWMFTHIPNICTPEAINGFNCPLARVHFNGSILWGVVGPHRFFGPGAIYRPLIWAFLLGALLPILVWLLGRRHRNSAWRRVNLPIVFGSLSWIPPATGLNFSVWALVCFLFNSVIKRKAFAWWSKYTMTLSAALDSGMAFSLLAVFFGFVYPGWDWIQGFSWWGTEVYKQGCDWKACPWKVLGEGERFGP